MTVRAKFTVMGVWKKGETEVVNMMPVFSPGENSENRKFWSATPDGSLTMHITNTDAHGTFQLGEEYYLDFTKAE